MFAFIDAEELFVEVTTPVLTPRMIGINLVAGLLRGPVAQRLLTLESAMYRLVEIR